jgi:SUKH superfamily protein
MEFDEFEALLRGAQAKYAGGMVPEGLSLFDSLRASDRDLDHVESELAVRLPEKYREFMKQYGGGQFLFVDLLPAISEGGWPEDLVMVNSDASWRGAFVTVAPVGTGDWWGFSVADGVCKESVDFVYHEDGVIEEGRQDFLVFLSKQALRIGN